MEKPGKSPWENYHDKKQKTMGKTHGLKKKKLWFLLNHHLESTQKLKDRNGICLMNGREKPWYFLGINFQGAPGLTNVWPIAKWFNAHCARNIRVFYVLGKRSSKSRKKTIQRFKDWDRKWHEAQLTLRCNFNWNILVQKQLLTNGKSMENTGKSTEIWLITCKVPITQKITDHLHFENTSQHHQNQKQFTSFYLHNIQPSSHPAIRCHRAMAGSACCRFSWVKCSKSRKLRGTWVHLAWIACRTKSLPEIAVLSRTAGWCWGQNRCWGIRKKKTHLRSFDGCVMFSCFFSKPPANAAFR